MLLLAPQRTAFLFCLFLLIILAADKQNQANADAADINHDGTDKIVGGTLAVRGEFPGYATPSGSNTLCGAYLIQNNILVTAAHCARAFDVYTVHIGGIQRSSKKEVGEETIAIDDVCVHPDYDEPTFQNDIMLIRLRKPSMKPLKEYYTASSYIRVKARCDFIRGSAREISLWIVPNFIVVHDCSIFGTSDWIWIHGFWWTCFK
jgi:secreted trypsin-like serine protease